MSTIEIVGGQVHTPDGFELGDITIAGDTVVSSKRVQKPEGSKVIDATGLFVSPGFIDLQINGGFGLDLAEDPSALWQLGAQLPQHGVTSFLPTIITAPMVTFVAAIAAIRHRPEGYVGAEPLGLHFEGPMLNASRRGVHSAQYLVAADRKVIDDWTFANGVAMVTIAPELPGAISIVEELRRRDITVAAGHSDATSDQARAGVEAGVSMVTHLFNAMAPLGHRNPNLSGFALAERSLVAGLIVDGVHVDPVIVAAAFNAKGPEGIALVTDAVAAMGRPPGTFEFANRTITADENSVRDKDGTLAGSVLTMDRAIRNLVSYTNCRPHQALQTATATPARVIGDTRRGQIGPGALADITLLDQNLEVQITLCSGRIVYVAEKAASRIPSHTAEVT